MAKVIEELRRSGASEVDLWVDKAREPARGLYKACGFEEMESVEDYYGGGRAGGRMELEL